MSGGETFRRGESRHPEWDLMYCKGLTVGQIAVLCGAVRETVGRHLRVQRSRFSDMQLQHEANRPPAKPRAISRSWQATIDSLSAIWKAEGHYPTSSDPDFQRRRLAHWLSVQRRASSNGTLMQARKAALEVLPRWEENQRLARDLICAGWTVSMECKRSKLSTRGGPGFVKPRRKQNVSWACGCTDNGRKRSATDC